MIFFILKIISFLFIVPLWGHSAKDTLKEAQKSYQQGVDAKTYQERKQAFNQALSFYLTLENEYPDYGDLDHAIGDIYFQLSDYPWAVLYYEKALKKNQINSSLTSHLEKARKTLGLKLEDDKTNQINQWFSPFAQHFNILYTLIAITFLSASYLIWRPHPFARKWTIGCTIILSLLMTQGLIDHYLTPIEGVLIKSTGLYREPDWNQSQLTDEPLLAGAKIQILEMTKDGNWLKISKGGLIGYIPTDHLRPI